MSQGSSSCTYIHMDSYDEDAESQRQRSEAKKTQCLRVPLATARAPPASDLFVNVQETAQYIVLCGGRIASKTAEIVAHFL